MSNYTVFEGMTMKFKISVPPVTGVITDNILATDYSSKVFHQGKRAVHQLAYQVIGATNGTCTQTVPFFGVINANSIKNKSELKDFVLDNAEGNEITLIGQTGTGSPCSFKTTIQINDPSNDKVKMV